MREGSKETRLDNERVHGLDLLRTLAILLVVLWHLPRSMFPFNWKPATWTGVDLFFVLSGYLIGSQLLRPCARGARFSFGEFYIRRAMRVLPAYLFVLLLYFLVPQFREDPGLSSIWKFLTFTQNFGLDYIVKGAFSHAWSLCVEEHFYLVLPPLIAWFMKRPDIHRVVLLTSLILIGGIALRAILWVHFVQEVHGSQRSVLYLKEIYYPTYARLDGLLIGLLIAATKLFRPVLWQRLTSCGNKLLFVAIAILVFAFWICQEMTSLASAIGGFPLLAIGFGLLVISSLSPGSFLARHRFWGASAGATLAYSIYLTHKEIMHLDRQYVGNYVNMESPLGFLVLALSILAAASLLYLCVERPFLILREKLLKKRAATESKYISAEAGNR